MADEIPMTPGIEGQQARVANVLNQARMLKQQYAGDVTKAPGYLGRGTNGVAFTIEGMVVKYSNFGADSTKEEVARLEKARGIPRVVQLVEYDIAEGIIVTELLPGENVQALDVERIPLYKDSEIIGVIDTIYALQARGLGIDPKPGNFMHDQTGFYVLDPLDANDEFYPITDQVMGLIHMLTYKGSYKEQPEEVLREDTKQRYQTMIQLLNIVKTHYPQLYGEIQERNKASILRFGKNNGGYLKSDLFEDDPDMQALKVKAKSLLEGERLID